MSDADIFRAAIPTSTDPARLEREAKRAEKRMTAEIVDRLRLLERKGYGPVGFMGTCRDAADEIERLRRSPPERDAVIEECAGIVDAAVEIARLHNPDSAHTRGANAYASATAQLALRSCALEIRALAKHSPESK